MGRNEFEEEEGYYQATLPLNIASGTFVQSATDNADYLQDSVDGNQSVQVFEYGFSPRGVRTSSKEPGFPWSEDEC